MHPDSLWSPSVLVLIWEVAAKLLLSQIPPKAMTALCSQCKTSKANLFL